VTTGATALPPFLCSLACPCVHLINNVFGNRLLVNETLAVFYCALPPPCNTILEFRCRDSSCGALESGEEAATLAEEDYTVDPNFFDEGYSMAGSTGFKVR
jgi:hypothetical protein